MKSIRDKFEACSGPGSETRLKTSEKISKRLIKRLKERKKDYGNVRDNDSSSSSVRSSCLRRYEPRNELRQISYEAEKAWKSSFGR